ncbi:hypothetical protein [Rufibacter soli]|jgi:hypothetical protein
MKTTSLLYFAGAALAVITAALRIAHLIERPTAYLLFSVTLALGVWANELRRREIKKDQQ